MQVKIFKPQLVVVKNESLVDELTKALADVEHKPEIIPRDQGVIEIGHRLLSLLTACFADVSHFHYFVDIACNLFPGCSPPRCYHCSHRNSKLHRFEADRLLIEMRGAFGKPQGTCAHVAIGQVLLSVRCKYGQETFRKAKFKFPSCQKIIVSKK